MGSNVKKAESGFSLIELLVVVGILGVIVSISIAVFNPQEQLAKSTDSRRKSDLNQIQKALEAYYNDFGKYPANDAQYQIQVTQSGTPDSIEWGENWTPYMNVLPADPKFPAKWYVYVSDGSSYRLYASLDRGGKDPNSCRSGLKCLQAPDKICGSKITDVCDYGVTSQNTSP